MSNMMLEQGSIGTIYSNPRLLADSQISVVRRYDYINEMAGMWILESNKEEEAHIEQNVDSSRESSDTVQEDKEQTVSLPIDDCCKRKSRR